MAGAGVEPASPDYNDRTLPLPVFKPVTPPRRTLRLPLLQMNPSPVSPDSVKRSIPGEMLGGDFVYAEQGPMRVDTGDNLRQVNPPDRSGRMKGIELAFQVIQVFRCPDVAHSLFENRESRYRPALIW